MRDPGFWYRPAKWWRCLDGNRAAFDLGEPGAVTVTLDGESCTIPVYPDPELPGEPGVTVEMKGTQITLDVYTLKLPTVGRWRAITRDEKREEARNR